MNTQLLPPIVTVEELVGRTDIVLCDVRWYLDRTPGRSKYNEGHIPGSIFVDLDEHLATLPRKSEGRHPLPAAASFATSLGSLGISHNDPVVAYDDSGGMSASRLVWMLRVLGHDAALLDGGLQGWTGQLETSPHVRSAVDHPIREWPTELFADADAAATAGNDSSQVLIDARSPDRFSGENEPVDPKAGHIPGAINIPHQTMDTDSTAQIDKASLVVTYCDGIGCNASTKGALNMVRLGFRVKELQGGILWWKQDGYATE